jgi:branched-chain amino acid transport system ATP-binding protein
MLAVTGLCKRFYGLLAVNDVSFSVASGEIVGLIGPNGAGKTTTFNLVSGRYRLTSGKVRMDGTRIDGLRPDRIASLGITRTFQGTRLFPRMTATENLCTALMAHQPVGFWADWLGLRSARAAQDTMERRAAEVLDFIGLAAQADTLAGALPYAHQSLLGIGLALAPKPRLLLMDEPFAGMNPTETAAAATMVRRIRDAGVTVLLVEHDMPAVLGLCDRIVVLDHGAKIAECAPAEIRNHPRVIEAYLGTDDDA